MGRSLTPTLKRFGHFGLDRLLVSAAAYRILLNCSILWASEADRNRNYAVCAVRSSSAVMWSNAIFAKRSATALASRSSAAVAFDKHHIVIRDVIRLAIRRVNSEWLEWTLLHSPSKLRGCNHNTTLSAEV
jgi:hypothetical protein